MTFRDCEGTTLALSDPVTVQWGERTRTLARSHGVIEKFGTKLVHVRITLGRSELDEGAVKPIPPDLLKKGHHGEPRHPGGFVGEIRDALSTYVADVLAQAVEAEIITAEQRTAILQLKV